MKQANIPVLYIAFARPEYARQSFDAIKAVRPKKLYFYSNKGREGNADEIERNNIVRSLIKEVDWECELHSWFRDESVDVYTSLFGAINWFFEKEEMGAIIEEDCVTSPAFYDFAQQMLVKYKDDKRIWMVSGSNYIEGYNPHGHNYIFSHNMLIHGWASWKDRWQRVDWNNIDFFEMVNEGVFDAVFDTDKQRKYHSNRILKQQDFIKRTHCWDLIFTSTGRSLGALSVLPSHNLVKNVGLKGAHTNSKEKSIVYNGITFDKDVYKIVDEPKYVLADVLWDEKLFQELHVKPYSIQNKIRGFIHSLINKFH